jgi:hypothetical protein
MGAQLGKQVRPAQVIGRLEQRRPMLSAVLRLQLVVTPSIGSGLRAAASQYVFERLMLYAPEQTACAVDALFDLQVGAAARRHGRAWPSILDGKLRKM